MIDNNIIPEWSAMSTAQKANFIRYAVSALRRGEPIDLTNLAEAWRLFYGDYLLACGGKLHSEGGNLLSGEDTDSLDLKWPNTILPFWRNVVYRIMSLKPKEQRNAKEIALAVFNEVQQSPINYGYTGSWQWDQDKNGDFNVHPNEEHDLNWLFLYGNTKNQFNPITKEEYRGHKYGPFLAKNYPNKNIENYYGNFTPANKAEVVADLAPVVDYLAKRDIGIYSDAIKEGFPDFASKDEVKDAVKNGWTAEDSGAYRVGFGYSPEGKPEIQFSDLIDFGGGYKDKWGTIAGILGNLLNSVGNPVILRQYTPIEYVSNREPNSYGPEAAIIEAARKAKLAWKNGDDEYTQVAPMKEVTVTPLNNLLFPFDASHTNSPTFLEWKQMQKDDISKSNLFDGTKTNSLNLKDLKIGVRDIISYINKYKAADYWTLDDINHLASKLYSTGWDPEAILYVIGTESSYNPNAANPVSSARGLALITNLAASDIFGEKNYKSIMDQYNRKKRTTHDSIDDAFRYYSHIDKLITNNRDNMGYGRLKVNMLAPYATLDTAIKNVNGIYDSLTSNQKKYVASLEKKLGRKATFADLMEMYDKEFNNRDHKKELIEYAPPAVDLDTPVNIPSIIMPTDAILLQEVPIMPEAVTKISYIPTNPVNNYVEATTEKTSGEELAGLKALNAFRETISFNHMMLDLNRLLYSELPVWDPLGVINNPLEFFKLKGNGGNLFYGGGDTIGNKRLEDLTDEEYAWLESLGAFGQPLDLAIVDLNTDNNKLRVIHDYSNVSMVPETPNYSLYNDGNYHNPFSRSIILFGNDPEEYKYNSGKSALTTIGLARKGAAIPMVMSSLPLLINPATIEASTYLGSKVLNGIKAAPASIWNTNGTLTKPAIELLGSTVIGEGLNEASRAEGYEHFADALTGGDWSRSFANAPNTGLFIGEGISYGIPGIAKGVSQLPKLIKNYVYRSQNLYPEFLGVRSIGITDPTDANFILKTPKEGYTKEELALVLNENNLLNNYSFILPQEHLGNIEESGLFYPVFRLERITPYSRESIFDASKKLKSAEEINKLQDESNQLLQSIYGEAESLGLLLKDGRILTKDGLIKDFGELHNIGRTSDGRAVIFDGMLDTSETLPLVLRVLLDNGKITLSLPSHTESNPRLFVLEPQGNNKFYVHMRTWDGDHIPANLTNSEKQQLFDALYDELPEGAEILFPKSNPTDYLATRGTVAGLKRLERDPRFTPGTEGTLYYTDKDGSVKTFNGTSFIKNKNASINKSYTGSEGLPPYQIKTQPGYMLRTLMSGNPLEKQLSKTGTINVNSIKALANKASNVEKAVINKVLNTKFNGLKSIDYNSFRKAVQEELVTFNRTYLTKYNDYGIDRIGFKKDIIPAEATVGDIELMYPGRFQTTFRPFKMVDSKTGKVITNNTELHELVKTLNDEKDYKLNTFTFESPRILIGNGKHYDGNTLGHSRTYTTADEPEVLHVMESLSDWGQTALNTKPTSLGHLMDVDDIDFTKTTDTELVLTPKGVEKMKLYHPVPEQEKYLHDNYIQRQILENLKYAAEHGQTKMRYPTRETAAKIEGYTANVKYGDEYNKLLEEYKDLDVKIANLNTTYRNNGVEPISQSDYRKLLNKRSDIKALLEQAKKDAKLVYSSEHETILKKYSDFPKMFKKLYKDAEVKTITDSRGYTWYEVDVPKDYLNQEWLFALGGLLNKKVFKY